MRVHLAPGWNAGAGQGPTRVCPLPATEWHGGDPAAVQAEWVGVDLLRGCVGRGEDSPAALRASPRHRIVGVAAEQVAGALPLAAGLPEVSTEEEREHWQGGVCARGVYWLLGCTFNPFMFSWDREVLIKY
eukprot:scaffold96856_cov63-Phaeocystis_antarctica.AAC.8